MAKQFSNNKLLKRQYLYNSLINLIFSYNYLFYYVTYFIEINDKKTHVKVSFLR